jgi:hypothetical protein
MPKKRSLYLPLVGTAMVRFAIGAAFPVWRKNVVDPPNRALNAEADQKVLGIVQTYQGRAYDR